MTVLKPSIAKINSAKISYLNLAGVHLVFSNFLYDSFSKNLTSVHLGFPNFKNGCQHADTVDKVSSEKKNLEQVGIPIVFLFYFFCIVPHFVLTQCKRFYVRSESVKSYKIWLEIFIEKKYKESVSDPLCTEQRITAKGKLAPKPLHGN